MTLKAAATPTEVPAGATSTAVSRAAHAKHFKAKDAFMGNRTFRGRGQFRITPVFSGQFDHADWVVRLQVSFRS